MFSNLFYHKKTGVLFTVFILIFLPIYSVMESGSFYFVFSWMVYIVLYAIPINIIVIFQKISNKKKLKKQEYIEKLKFYESNLGHKLLDEFNECKTDADYKLWEERNSQYFETVRDFVIQKLEKKQNNSLIKINKTDKKINVLNASVRDKKSLIQDLLKRHSFLMKILNQQFFRENVMPHLTNIPINRNKK